MDGNQLECLDPQTLLQLAEFPQFSSVPQFIIHRPRRDDKHRLVSLLLLDVWIPIEHGLRVQRKSHPSRPSHQRPSQFQSRRGIRPRRPRPRLQQQYPLRLGLYRFSDKIAMIDMDDKLFNHPRHSRSSKETQAHGTDGNVQYMYRKMYTLYSMYSWGFNGFWPCDACEAVLSAGIKGQLWQFSA